MAVRTASNEIWLSTYFDLSRDHVQGNATTILKAQRDRDMKGKLPLVV